MAVLVFSLWRAWSDQCARRPGVAFYIKAGISSWWLRDQENPWGGVWSRYTLASLSASSIPSRIQWPLTLCSLLPLYLSCICMHIPHLICCSSLYSHLVSGPGIYLAGKLEVRQCCVEQKCEI